MKVVAKNKKAKYNYEFKEKLVAGISLLGSEVKSIKLGNVSLDGTFVKLDQNKSAQLYGMNVAKYEFQNLGTHDPTRTRQLLLTKRELKKINNKIVLERLSIIPTKIFINSYGLIKIELSIGKARKLHDKREYKKKQEADRIKRNIT